MLTAKTPHKRKPTEYEEYIGRLGYQNEDYEEESEDIKTVKIKHANDVEGSDDEPDDRYFLQANGKVLPDQVGAQFKDGYQKKELSRRVTKDPFQLERMMFFNLDFDVEMTHVEKDVTYVFNGAIANK